MSRAVISVKNLRKSYGSKKVLDAVDLEVNEREIFALIGPNGSGKTTMVECLVGVTRDYEGDVKVFGLSPDSYEVKRRMGVQLESPFLLWNLKVAEMFDLVGSLYPQRLNAATLIERFKLSGLKGSYLRKLSKGERQRVAVCAAFIGNPDILILDEPTSGLSPELRADFWQILKTEAERGRTIFFTTHYLEEAEKWADRVALLFAGRIVLIGRPRELIAGVIGAGRKVVCTGQVVQDLLSNCRIPGVTRWVVRSSQVVLYTDTPKQAATFLLEKGVSDFAVSDASLEDVYLEATGYAYTDVEDKVVTNNC